MLASCQEKRDAAKLHKPAEAFGGEPGVPSTIVRVANGLDEGVAQPIWLIVARKAADWQPFTKGLPFKRTVNRKSL
jgi:hypothetical protein